MSLPLRGPLLAPIFALSALLPVKASAGPLAALGSLERSAVKRTLTLRGLEIDPDPQGKRIGSIYIQNLEVFGPDTGWLRVLNVAHITTRERIIRRELLVRPGDLYREARLEESERILRNPTFSSFVVIVPIASGNPDLVDILVVTRDVWSLRTNSSFVYQDARLSSFQVAAAENNLLGRRKHLSFILEMTQGDYSLSTRWRDLNIGGSRWQLIVRPGLIFGRKNDSLEGYQNFVRIVYPLWSLASRWGFFFEATQSKRMARNFVGAELATFDAPTTSQIETLPQEYLLRQLDLRSLVSLYLGQALKHTLSLGHELKSTRPSMSSESNASPEARRAFANELFPREELASALFFAYELFEPTYVTYRNIDTFDLPEVLATGPRVGFEAALGLRLFGGERNFLRQRLRVGYLLDLGKNSFARIDAGVGGRMQRDSTNRLVSVDRELSVDWFATTPVLFDALRALTSGTARLNTAAEENSLLAVGGQGDLRGYPAGQFRGTSTLLSQLELRSLPWKLGFSRVGFVAFWDAGHAADSPRNLRLHHDVGISLKALIPQVGASLLALSWAFPVGGSLSAFPGRVSLSFSKPAD